MKAAVFPNFQKENALECARAVCDILHKCDIEVWIDSSFKNEFSDKPQVKFGLFDEFVRESDFAVAIGGDGTILKCASHIINCDTKLLGINTGRLGFMSALESDSLEHLSRLKTGDYTVTERMMLECEILGKEHVYTALNDVTASGMYTRICDFSLFDERGRIGSYRADGAVFSTPTGSTAYSLSAGGPIIDPCMECIEMTLICPHSLFARPMIFPAWKKIRFLANEKNRQKLYLSVDGNESIEVGDNDVVEIRRSPHTIKLINMNENSFYNSLNKKMMHPIK
ncbi:MAG: NAD(+)/NADH kinase [Oscillospiraceae bacterium]|nr:NAD(+)/NADH kinase [Oscillospiraceae bacterium]